MLPAFSGPLLYGITVFIAGIDDGAPTNPVEAAREPIHKQLRELIQKRLEVFTEAILGLSRVVVL
jgi:hypothetical protein